MSKTNNINLQQNITAMASWHLSRLWPVAISVVAVIGFAIQIEMKVNANESEIKRLASKQELETVRIRLDAVDIQHDYAIEVIEEDLQEIKSDVKEIQRDVQQILIKINKE